MRYFAEFDAVAPDFDLVVGASAVVQLSVGASADQVSGAIHAGAGGRRMGRPQTVIRSAPGVANSPRPHRDPRRTALPPRQVAPAAKSSSSTNNAAPGHRRADRHDRGVCGAQWCADGGIDRGFGGPIAVDHHPPGSPSALRVRADKVQRRTPAPQAASRPCGG